MDILKYILFLFVLIPLGCVDITPISNIENDQKLFVFCEIEANKRTIADIYYLGNVNGNKIRQLNAGDTNSF